RMPELRTREANLRGQLDALDSQIADRDLYLALATDLEGFLSQLGENAKSADIADRQRVLRLLVKNVLIGPEKITIRHRIPLRQRSSDRDAPAASTDTEGDRKTGCQVRWGRNFPAPGKCRPASAR
ncbi:hypothetical protein MXD63_40415, partial [Frankia sp. Cpl3]|nr:hypothetical protein [Frankia sp. Cpl3]